MAVNLKSVARSGLRKVAGNVLSTALGSVLPRNIPSLGFPGGSGPFKTDVYSFPNNVADDPAQGHYINFTIFETKPGKVIAESIKAAKIKKFNNELDPGQFAGPGELGGQRSPAIIQGVDVNSASYKSLAAARLDSNKSGGGANKRNSIRLQRSSKQRVGSVISLYMPPNITASYKANYTDEPIGAIAETGMGVIDAIQRGKSGEALDVLQEGGSQGLRQVVLGLLNAPFAGARALYAIEKGQVITPRLELMFNGMSRREFSYSFVFIPRDQSESQTVENIVKSFKSNMAADYNESEGIIAGMRTMGLPNIFKIDYMYKGSKNTHLNEIGHCALRNVEVSYGGDRFVSYEGGYPQQTKLTLSFSEMDIVTKTMINDSAGGR